MIKFIKVNWWRFPFVPFRVVMLSLAWYVFLPIGRGLEYLGENTPGLTRP